MSEKFTLAPASIPQQNFLESNSTITLYSGSAGAGKTFAIIISLVRYALEKNSTIAVFRRTSTQLRQNGGIWQETCHIFKQMFKKDLVIRNRDLEIYIPSTNSTIKMSHLQHQSDVSNHLGAQYSYIVFDEATLFPFEEMILPLMGRLRSANTTYTPRMAWCTNPQYNHGIYHWIKDFYLDEFGIPYDHRSNVERYFVMENSKPVWFDDRKEAEALYGSGPDSGISSFRAIKAHVTQNIPLLKANPQYLSNLKALPEIKRRIFLDGSWTAREEEAGLYNRTWSKVVPYPNMKAKRRVRAYDLASQPVSSQSPNPDWTRGTLISKDDEGIYTVEDVVSARDRPHVITQLILDTARRDKEMYGNIIVSIPLDPGAAGASVGAELRRKLAEIGVVCKLTRPNKSKRTRFLPASAIAESGYLNVVKADWNEEFYCELEEFTGLKPRERDDIVDTVSDCILVLNQELVLPSFSLPTFESSSQSFGLQSTDFSTGLTAKLN